MGRRIQYILEILIFLTLFSMFSSFTITTYQTDDIIDVTEEFTELVRYKGCITEDMYFEYLEQYPTPVSLTFVIEKGKVLQTSQYLSAYEFTGDVMEAISTDGIYKMEVGDSIQVIVRKQGRSYFDALMGAVTKTSERNSVNPIVAVKGGLILNEQYDKEGT